MGKYITREKEDAQVLFKKSNVCNYYSRTCSDGSRCTKKSLAKVKKSASKTNLYYTDGHKIKRDFSIETDNCKIRRYLKKKRASIYGASSGNTKYSTMLDTEDTCYEYKLFDSASGDNRNTKEFKRNPNIVDVTSLMLENLKTLLNDWICKHVLEDDKTKHRLNNLIDSIMHNLDNKVSGIPSSCSTYVLERNGKDVKVRNRRVATNVLTCQYCNKKQTSAIIHNSSSVSYKKYSRVTIPVSYKHLRIISTLSIPRNLNPSKKTKKPVQLTNKIQKDHHRSKNHVVSSNKKEQSIPIKLSAHSAQCTPKNHKTKHFMRRKKQNKRRGILIIPQTFYDTTPDIRSSSETGANLKVENVRLEQNDSLLMSIYNDNTKKNTSTDETIECENKDNDDLAMAGINYTIYGNLHGPTSTQNNENAMTKQNKLSDPSHDHNKITPKRDPKRERIRVKKQSRNNKTYYRTLNSFQWKTKKITYNSIKYKKFNYLYRKANRNPHTEELLDHMRNLFQYFAEYNGKKNIKLEVHVEVYPSFEVEEEICDVISKPSNNLDIKVCPTNVLNIDQLLVDSLESNEKSEENATTPNPAIIPILDGATSQARYIFRSNNSSISKSENPSEETEVKSSTKRDSLMTSLEISQEISNLKCVIKDLSVATEKIVIEHLKRKRMQNDSSLVPTTPSTPVPTTVPSVECKSSTNKTPNASKYNGIQFSNISPNSQLMSGLKLCKEPKKMEDLSSRFKKRSSSYHVIESESVIRVTDMTSPKLFADKCNSPHKAKRRLRAFFYSERKKDNYKDNRKSNKKKDVFKSKGDPSPVHRKRIDKKVVMSMQMNESQCIACPTSQEYVCKLPSYTSICVESDEEPIKPTIKLTKKECLSTLEGVLYCVLLWIPLIIIIYFFYDYVLKDLLSGKKQATTASADHSDSEPKFQRQRQQNEKPENVSQMLLKLSDFGF